MIEITPTEPLPYPSGVPLDGNDAVWNNPILPYLDGNWTAPKYGRQRQVLKDVTKPKVTELGGNRWTEGNWVYIDIKTYIDGNKVLYQGQSLNYIEIADGNIRLIDCRKEFYGEYKGAPLLWEKDGIKVYSDRTILGATKPVYALDYAPDYVKPIGYNLTDSKHEPKRELKLFPGYVNTPNIVPWDEYGYGWDNTYTFFEPMNIQLYSRDDMTLIGIDYGYGYGYNYLFKINGKLYLSYGYKQIKFCTHQIDQDPEFEFVGWHPDIPFSSSSSMCPDANTDKIYAVGDTIDMFPHTERKLKWYDNHKWYDLLYQTAFNYKVTKVTTTYKNVYNKLVIVDPTTKKGKF